MGPNAVREAIWNALKRGSPLGDFELSVVDGRIDLRGLEAPDPRVVELHRTRSRTMARLDGLVTVDGATWRSIDFSGAQLRSLRFFNSRIENCRFDGADCADLRMWGTTIVDSSFRSANLRGAALGGIGRDKRRNAFVNVDFSGADLRETAHGSADFTRCTFSNCNLTRVNFEGSVFDSCTFSGELREVLFYRHGFRKEEFPPNEMRNVDFRGSSLRMVAFRRLDLETVRWPDDPDHVVIHGFRAALERGLERLSSRQDLGSRQLRVHLEITKKWLGENQDVGVLNRLDLVDAAGEDATRELLSVMQPN